MVHDLAEVILMYSGQADLIYHMMASRRVAYSFTSQVYSTEDISDKNSELSNAYMTMIRLDQRLSSSTYLYRHPKSLRSSV